MEQNLVEFATLNLQDRVKIIPDTRFYGGSPEDSNPKDVEGTVIRFDGEWARVKWDNGKENGYEIHDLTVLGDHERIYYDTNKIYLSREPKDIKDIFEILYPSDDRFRTQETYSLSVPGGKRLLQCHKGRMRSFDDLWIIANTYFPDTDPAVVFREMLLFNVTLEQLMKEYIPKQLSNCSTMQRIRYTNSLSSLYSIWASCDCGKYKSVYKWRDLFNMIYINNLDQLKEWYLRELTIKDIAIKEAKEDERRKKLLSKPNKHNSSKKVVLEKVNVIPLSLRPSKRLV